MDATLLRDDKTYDKERFEVIANQLMDKGIIICIASGNSYHKLVEFFSPSLIERMYFAGDNGNYLVKNRQTQRVVGIPQQEYLQIVDYFDSLSDYFVSISTGEVTYLRENRGVAYDKIKKYNNEMQQIDDFRLIPSDQLATKLAVFSHNSLAKHKTVARTLMELLPDVSTVTSGDQWIDSYHVKGGKGSVIRFLQEELEISKEESMAFGDSLNDETMMKEVKYSIAMSNADADLALHCHYQIGSNQDQAVLDVLEQLCTDLDATFMKKYQLKR